MGPASYMQTVVDRDVAMRHIPVFIHTDHIFNEASPTNISSRKTSPALHTIPRCNLQTLCEMLRSVWLNINRWHDRYHCNENVNTKEGLKYTFLQAKCSDVRCNGAVVGHWNGVKPNERLVKCSGVNLDGETGGKENTGET